MHLAIIYTIVTFKLTANYQNQATRSTSKVTAHRMR